ncbi:MAG: ComEC/Rec2 family competence protein [Elusimicrobiota bacterium]
MKNRQFNQRLLLFVLPALILFSGACASFPKAGGERYSPRLVSAEDYKKSDADLTVSFVDVGQGNCILAEFPRGKNMLYDAGGAPLWMDRRWDPGREKVVPYLKKRGVKKIDYLVISHPHADHMGGMQAVIRNFDIGIVLDPGFEHPSPLYEELLELIAEKEISYAIMRRGEDGIIDAGPDFKVEVLNPPADFYFYGSNSDANNNSIVIKLIYGNVSFLFTGDIEKRPQKHLLERYRGSLESEVLQVAHHGSDMSSMLLFMKAVSPELAIIPVGERNVYGHPGAGTLRNLKKSGAQVLRTDINANVRVYTDGEIFMVEKDR